MTNSTNVCNTLTDAVKCRQQRKTKLNRSSKLCQLERNNYQEEDESLSPLDDIFVKESVNRIFKAYNSLSRDELETIWDKIAVQAISN